VTGEVIFRAKSIRESEARAVTGGQRVLLFLSLAGIAALAACGGPNNLTLQNASAPASTSASIAFSSTPVTSISLVGTASLTAVVSDDPTNAGVDWALLCQNAGNCGTLAPLHTSSGSPAIYQPPASISGNSQAVTIEAFAAANHDANVNTSLTVTGFAGNLKGTYVFEATGEDGNVGAFQLAGAIVLDGNGNVTSGEQTYSDAIYSASTNLPVLVSVADKITGGSYYIGPDGRGTLTLNTADQNVGQGGIENFAFVFLSNSKALIQTLDNATISPQSFEATSGTLDLQTSPAAPTGGYAFVVNGIDVSSGSPLALTLGGVFNIDSPNTISGAGSVADEDDAYALTSIPGLSGTLTSPDSFGSVKFSLSASNPTAFPPFTISLQFTGYVIDAKHIKLIETNNNGNEAGTGISAGVAIGQGAATGTFNNGSAFAGNYVFDIAGEDPSGLPDTLASVGLVTVDSSGDLSSAYDDEYMVTLPLGFTDSFTGTYTLFPPGTGRVDTNSTITFAVEGQGPELIFYLTGEGNPPLVLDSDVSGATGIGFAHPQAAAPYSFNGRYGFESVQSNGEVPSTYTGQVTAAESAETFAGLADANVNFIPSPANNSGSGIVNGTFGSIPSTGRFTGTLSGSAFENAFTSLPNSTASVAFYPVDADHIFLIETDFSTSDESTFGYFSTRTPVCSTCP
jgi:hypothetical protein